MMTAVEHLSLEQVFTLASDALLAQGFSAAQAQAIASNVTAAERDGCKSHGLFRIPFYVKALKNPDCNPTAEPEVSTDSSAVVHVDAHSGFCPLALQLGLTPLASKARKHGIAALAIHRTYNIAALWPEVEQLAVEGFVAMAFTAATATVAPAGGSKPLYGTNPMAFAFPRQKHPPLVFDQASAASARGEIQLRLRAGETLPEGWAIDVDGQPTTDPATALAGAQLPFGGHKGAALALMVELLAGALIGDLFSYEATEHDQHKVGAPYGGELVLALDPSHFSPLQTAAGGSIGPQTARAEALFSKILEQDGTRLPSDRRYQARKSNVEKGVDIERTLFDTIAGFRS